MSDPDYSDHIEDILEQFPEMPKFSELEDDSPERSWLLIAETLFEQDPEGGKILADRHALGREQEGRETVRMGQTIRLDTSFGTPEEIKAAKAELAREAKQDRANFAERLQLLDKRAKPVLEKLKAQFLAQKTESKEQENG